MLLQVSLGCYYQQEVQKKFQGKLRSFTTFSRKKFGDATAEAKAMAARDVVEVLVNEHKNTHMTDEEVTLFIDGAKESAYEAAEEVSVEEEEVSMEDEESVSTEDSGDSSKKKKRKSTTVMAMREGSRKSRRQMNLAPEFE